ncbi:MAG: hypothetical protein KKH22_06655 [Proteobacteria bacterium]|nr:hypothetical protein [Pseudomonadota bacterium]
MKKTVKNSITIPQSTVDELARRHGGKKNALSGQVSSDLRFYHALLDLLGMEAMIDGSFSEAEILLLIAATTGMKVDPGSIAGIAPRIAAALAEHTSKDNHQAMSLLSHKVMKLSISKALWLWDRLTVYRANSDQNQNRGYLLALFGVR